MTWKQGLSSFHYGIYDERQRLVCHIARVQNPEKIGPLIAAAPELFAALKDVLGDLELLAAKQGNPPSRRYLTAVAAIAKAEGK